MQLIVDSESRQIDEVLQKSALAFGKILKGKFEAVP